MLLLYKNGFFFEKIWYYFKMFSLFQILTKAIDFFFIII